MNGNVFENLAKRIFKCPCCAQVFESQLRLRLHLCESHKAEICRSHRVQRPSAFRVIERPNKICFCGHCLEANTPELFASDAFCKIDNHIGTPNEKVFVIPIHYLMEHVIPNADRNDLGRYLFTVNPHDFVFTWDHGFEVEGRRFLNSNPTSADGSERFDKYE
jgi:hypothetical protein